MEAEMECVKRVIVEKEAELGRLPAGDPERVPLREELAAPRAELAALREEENIYLRQDQGALPPVATCMICISGWLSAMPRTYPHIFSPEFCTSHVYTVVAMCTCRCWRRGRGRHSW